MGQSGQHARGGWLDDRAGARASEVAPPGPQSSAVAGPAFNALLVAYGRSEAREGAVEAPGDTVETGAAA